MTPAIDPVIPAIDPVTLKIDPMTLVIDQVTPAIDPVTLLNSTCSACQQNNTTSCMLAVFTAKPQENHTA